jgi:hypothetical protein
VGEHEFIQAEADADADDSGEAQKALQLITLRKSETRF